MVPIERTVRASVKTSFFWSRKLCKNLKLLKKSLYLIVQSLLKELKTNIEAVLNILISLEAAR